MLSEKERSLLLLCLSVKSIAKYQAKQLEMISLKMGYMPENRSCYCSSAQRAAILQELLPKINGWLSA